jgi:hypothetical protein
MIINIDCLCDKLVRVITTEPVMRKSKRTEFVSKFIGIDQVDNRNVSFAVFETPEGSTFMVNCVLIKTMEAVYGNGYEH